VKSFLVIQTAYIGDVVLATSLVESIANAFPQCKIDFVVRKGNENLLKNNPNIQSALIWDKTSKKYANLFRLIRLIRTKKYDYTINLQRFTSTGLMTLFSKSKQKIGFKNSSLSWGYHHKVEHEMGNGKHEIERNLNLLKPIVETILCKPKLYPGKEDIDSVQLLTLHKYYIVMAPASIWFTKQLPMEKWLELIRIQSKEAMIFLIGGKDDFNFLEEIRLKSKLNSVINLAGKYSLLASAHLMKLAEMNYVNDSAPLHIASAVNAPVTAFFCSTVPAFGFTPLSDVSIIKEIEEPLSCRPCGLHGFKSCPKGHFDCGNKIVISS